MENINRLDSFLTLYRMIESTPETWMLAATIRLDVAGGLTGSFPT